MLSLLIESNVSSEWHCQSFNYIQYIHCLSAMVTRASITFIIYSYFGNDWFTNHVLFTVFLDCFDAAVNWNSPFTVRGRNSGAHGQNDTFCLQKALTVPKQQQFCLQTTQLVRVYELFQSTITQWTTKDKIQHSNQCTFLQRIGSRIRDALMQILLIPLTLFSNCGWKLKYWKCYTKYI